MASKIQQVKDHINSQIERRIYNPGQMIASESELVKRTGASRTTVRIALRDLVDRGVLYKEKGRGTFVAIRPRYSAFRWGCGFTKEAQRLGLTPSTIWASIARQEADSELAAKFKVDPGTPVWFVCRVRGLDGVPFVYNEEYFLYSQCPELDKHYASGSIYEYLAKFGIRFAMTDQLMSAVAASAKVAGKLGVAKSTPLIMVNGLSRMRNGLPFNCGTMFYRTDKYKITESIGEK